MGSYLNSKLLSIYLHTTTTGWLCPGSSMRVPAWGLVILLTPHMCDTRPLPPVCVHMYQWEEHHMCPCVGSQEIWLFLVSQDCLLFITWCSYSKSNWRWSNNGCDVTSLSVMFLLWWVNLDHIREWNKYILHQVKTS